MSEWASEWRIFIYLFFYFVLFMSDGYTLNPEKKKTPIFVVVVYS